jgi:hypothetical protein
VLVRRPVARSGRRVGDDGAAEVEPVRDAFWYVLKFGAASEGPMKVSVKMEIKIMAMIIIIVIIKVIARWK